MNAHATLSVEQLRASGMSWLDISFATGIGMTTLRYRYIPEFRETCKKTAKAYAARRRQNGGKPLGEKHKRDHDTREAVFNETCRHFRMSRREITDRSLFAHIVDARHVVCFLAREVAGSSYPEIGRMVRRDHTTARNACLRMAERIAAGEPIAAHVAAIRSRVSERKGVA